MIDKITGYRQAGERPCPGANRNKRVPGRLRNILSALLFLAVAFIILFSLSLAGCEGGSDLFAGVDFGDSGTGGDDSSTYYSSVCSSGSSEDDGGANSHCPEPSTLALLGLGGLAGLLGQRLRRRKK